MNVTWLVSNLETDDPSEILKTELASSRLRAGVCIEGISRSNGFKVDINLRSNFRPDIIFMSKFVYDSGINKYQDDGGVRFERWKTIVKSKPKGCLLVVDYTDNHFQNPNIVGEFYRNIWSEIDALVVPSDKMLREASSFFRGPIFKIEEPVEYSSQQVVTPDSYKDRKGILWFGHNSNLVYLADTLRSTPVEFLPTEILLVTNLISREQLDALLESCKNRIKFSPFKWSVKNLLTISRHCYLSIVPSSTIDHRKSGSSNGRLVTSLQLGLTALATPLESYMEFADYFSPINSNDFCHFSDPKAFISRADITSAQRIISERYSRNSIMQKWTNLIGELK